MSLPLNTIEFNSGFEPPKIYQPKNPDFLALMHEKLTRQYFLQHIGMGISRISPGYAEAYMPMAQHVEQQDGILHGGVTLLAADITTGFAAFSLCGKDDRVVTSDLKLSYYSPGVGEALFARGWVDKPGSRLMYCEAEVYMVRDGAFKQIAKGFTIMAVIEGRNKEVEAQGRLIL